MPEKNKIEGQQTMHRNKEIENADTTTTKTMKGTQTPISLPKPINNTPDNSTYSNPLSDTLSL